MGFRIAGFGYVRIGAKPVETRTSDLMCASCGVNLTSGEELFQAKLDPGELRCQKHMGSL